MVPTPALRSPHTKSIAQIVPVLPQPAEQCTKTGKVSDAWVSLTNLTMSRRGRTKGGTPWSGQAE